MLGKRRGAVVQDDLRLLSLLHGLGGLWGARTSRRSGGGCCCGFGGLGRRGRAIEAEFVSLAIVDLNNVDHGLPELYQVHPFLDEAERGVHVESIQGDLDYEAVGIHPNLGQHGKEVEQQEGTLVACAQREQDVLVAIIVLKEDVLGGSDVLVRLASGRDETSEMRHDVHRQHGLERHSILRIQLRKGHPQTGSRSAISDHVKHGTESGGWREPCACSEPKTNDNDPAISSHWEYTEALRQHLQLRDRSESRRDVRRIGFPTLTTCAQAFSVVCHDCCEGQVEENAPWLKYLAACPSKASKSWDTV